MRGMQNKVPFWAPVATLASKTLGINLVTISLVPFARLLDRLRMGMIGDPSATESAL
jgi:hypothetical protein